MNSVIDTLFLRRPKLEYISPPVCEFDFSSSGSPIIVLEDINKRRAPSGLVLGGVGNFRLSWDTYPGALCFSVYKAIDELDPFGDYELIAECISDNFIDLDDFGPGHYRVSAITLDGESDLSPPIEVSSSTPTEPTIEVVSLNPINTMSEDGTIVGVFGVRPGIHAGGITGDLRVETDSDPITASQLATTVTASDNIFSSGDVDKVIHFLTGEECQIVAFVSPLQVTVTPSLTVASTTFIIRGETLGGSIGNARVCNASGIVGGDEYLFGDSQLHSFWMNRETGEIRDLFAFTGAAGFVRGITEAGYALLQYNAGAHISSYLYDPNTETITDLGSIDGNLGQTTPVAINENLECAVSAQTIDPLPFPNTWNKAAKWASGVMLDLHPTEAGDNDSFARGINSLGHVFGVYSDSVTNETRSFLNQGGATFDIGGIGTAEVDAIAMNNSDTIVGTCDDGAGNFVPFIYTPIGGFQLIPLLGGTTSGQANDVNTSGEVVGTMDGIAFHYKDGVTTDLTEFLPTGSGWTSLSTGLFINDNRQVTGYGTHEAVFTGFLLQLV